MTENTVFLYIIFSKLLVFEENGCHVANENIVMHVCVAINNLKVLGVVP